MNTPANNLGLVCITRSDAVRYRTITRKRLRALGEEGQEVQRKTLQALYEANLERFRRATTFCAGTSIRLYRVTSHLFPFGDTPLGRSVLEEMADEVRSTGQALTDEGIRLVVHPDQFVVLNSDRPEVIENSIAFLEHQAYIFDQMDQPRSPWATIILHGGKGDRSDRLVEVTRALPEGIRTRLAFENDERTYGAEDILDVCRRAGVPMIFDAHHHAVHAGLDSYDDPSIRHYLHAARETWPDPSWQLVHISNGRDGIADHRHSDLIHTMPEAFRDAPWIEVEAKGKEEAIIQLQQDWL